MGRRAVAPAAALLVLGACSIWPAPSSSATQASTLKVAFKQADTYRYHYSSRLDATVALGQSPPLPIKADGSADATWKILSVDANGDTTVDVTLSNLKSTFTGSFLPGSTTTTTTTTTTTQHFQFKVAATGEIVSGGGPPSVPPSMVPLSPGLGLPGTNQFLATLPGRPVKPGDTWTKTITRPNPLGEGSITYTTDNRFLRYENLKSGRAAVIETTATVPEDFTVNLQMLAQVIGSSSNSPPPALAMPTSGQLHVQGTSTTVSTTWFDTNTGQIEKMISVDTSDMTTSLMGASSPLPIPIPSVPPGILPVSPGQFPPGVPWPQHFTGKHTLEFDLLT